MSDPKQNQKPGDKFNQAIKMDEKNALTTKKKQPDPISKFVKSLMPAINNALPKHLTADRMARILLTTFRTNPDLFKCNADSLRGCILESAQLGLPISNTLGQAYIVPFDNRKLKTLEATFIIGYKGLIELFYRNDRAKSITACEVCENDAFSYKRGTGAYLTHVPPLSDRGKVIAYYAVAEMQNGATSFEIMSKEDVEKHASNHSRGYSSTYSPWTKHFDAMAKKTVLKKLFKYLPISAEIQSHINDDGKKFTVDHQTGEITSEWVDDNNVVIEDIDDQGEAAA